MTARRILVTGSRDWDDRLAVYRELARVCDEFGLNYEPDDWGNTMPDPTMVTVVHGHCPTGADYWADEWCTGLFFEAERHPADWEKHGKRAGFLRNAEMVALGADICLAFIKNGSNGARHTAGLAEMAGIPTRRFEVTK